MSIQFQYTLSNGDTYAPPASILEGTLPVDFLFGLPDPEDTERTGPTYDLDKRAIAATASLFINVLERSVPADTVPLELNEFCIDAIDYASAGLKSVSLEEFANFVVPDLMEYHRAFIEVARDINRREGLTDELVDNMSAAMFAPTTQTKFAYEELKRTHTLSEIANAVALAFYKMLTGELKV